MKDSHINYRMIRTGQLVALTLLTITIIVALVAADMKHKETEPKKNPETSAQTEQMTPPQEEAPASPEIIPTVAPVSATEQQSIEQAPNTRYILTAEERRIVEAVVAAESASESFEGQVLVAQCILNSAEARGMRPDEIVLEKNQYATPRYDLAYMVEDAVAAVFDDGFTVTDEPIRFFYAPKYCTSKWHEESLTYVLTEGGHRFFKI